MSNITYLPLADIAKVCVLTEYTLQTKFWPDHWCVPRDWRFIRSTVIVNQASLPDLVRELAENGQKGTAAVLQRWIEENTAAEQLDDFLATRLPARGTVPAGGWSRQWEDRNQ